MKGYRTYIVMALVGLTGIIDHASADPLLTGWIASRLPESWGITSGQVLASIMMFAGFVMRSITSTAPMDGGDQK